MQIAVVWRHIIFRSRVRSQRQDRHPECALAFIILSPYSSKKSKRIKSYRRLLGDQFYTDRHKTNVIIAFRNFLRSRRRRVGVIVDLYTRDGSIVCPLYYSVKDIDSILYYGAISGTNGSESANIEVMWVESLRSLILLPQRLLGRMEGTSVWHILQAL
jgi:hypothetical protein